VMATFRIDSYNDSKSTAKLGPGETDTLVFSPYTATVGAHAVTAFADYTGDINRHNDTLKATVFVPAPPPPPPGGWAARTPMPSGAKAIKDGGWLAHDGGTHLIYASRGTKQPDFFSYNPANDSWKPLAPWQPGVEGKLPQKGSAACADGDGIIYATKGNNTLGFWAYNAGINVWTQKKDIPLGLSNKRVKGGTDLVFVAGKGHDTDYVYLLKGYKNEFYRYNTATDSWQTMTSAPVGGKEKWDKGSWLVEKKAPGPPPKPYTIYAHKAKYHEFYAYNTANDSWSPALQPMPTAGSAGNKKSKDGSCAALLDDSIYALKGGNTREFWRYSILDNAWAERETIPTGPFKKKVKAGSDIVTVGDVLYATKGNKSNELWMYTPSAYLFEPPRHDGVLAKATGSRVSRVEVSPNPLTSGFVTVHFTRPLESSNPRILLSIYNVAGQWIAAQTFVTGRSGVLSLDLRHLSNGVYLLEFSSGGFAVAQKLIVER